MVAPFYNERMVDCEGGKYTLVINIPAIIAAEQAAGMGLLEILGAMGGGGFRIGGMAAILWGMMRAKHPDVSLDEAGALLFTHGDKLTPVITDLVREALPKAKGKPSAENPPPRPRRGTGKASS